MIVEKLQEAGFDELCPGVHVCSEPRVALTDLPQYVGRALLPHDSDGTIVWDIKVDRSDSARSHGLDDFSMHTDAAFDEDSPRYVAMEVVQLDKMGGGVQSYLSLDDILKDLNPEAIEILATSFAWDVPAEFRTSGSTNLLPILFIVGDQLGIRYREDCIDSSVATTAQRIALDSLGSVIKNSDRFEYHLNTVGEQIVVDNWNVLHARTKVIDKARHLRRIRF